MVGASRPGDTIRRDHRLDDAPPTRDCHPMHLHAIDLLLLLVLAVTAVSGWRRGFAVVTLGYAGLLVGLAVGAWAAARVGLFISDEDSMRRLLVGIVVFFLVAVVCHSIATRFGVQLRSTITGKLSGNLDAVGGALVAVVVTAIALWFVALTLGSVPFSPLARALTDSSVLRTIDRVAPRPPAALSQLRGLLARSPFPDAFANLRPPAAAGAPPATLATPGVKRATATTVQIESEGCGGLLFGSGFPVEAHLVVTNAHVVAGTGDHRVIVPGRGRARGTVVWFDPRRDIALLSVPGVTFSPLELDGPVRAGTTGAVIGYPGGGGETVVGARVVARTTAVGRDIYSSSLVRREIYVLRAKVRKGDSGGPVVDRSGRLIGVVFAASTVDPNEGYALTNTELRTVLSQAGSNRAEVPVGQCAA
jgi:S1-C subfamily serine protease